MVIVELYQGDKVIPFLHTEVRLSYQGRLYVEGKEIDLAEFNAITGLAVKEVAVLLLVTYHRFAWPPTYWSDITALRMIEGEESPENLIVGLEKPIESKEFPGFYMIPYFSNYVISPKGTLIKKSDGRYIQASEGALGYYTFRMTDDSGKTQNQLRHRILCYAFKPYRANVDELDVNHKDGVPGNDPLENLEWVTRTENMLHAVECGLHTDNRELQVRDCNTDRIYIYGSHTQAAKQLNVSVTTISNRVKTEGYKAFNGLQFRPHPNAEEWPEICDDVGGKYLVEFPDGSNKLCGCNEAARLVGVTRTSLLRLLRDGRNSGNTQNKVSRIPI